MNKFAVVQGILLASGAGLAIGVSLFLSYELSAKSQNSLVGPMLSVIVGLIVWGAFFFTAILVRDLQRSSKRSKNNTPPQEIQRECDLVAED